MADKKYRPTKDDKRECRSHNADRHLSSNGEDTDGPDVIMLSVGYCDLWVDGDIVFHGITIGNCYE